MWISYINKKNNCFLTQANARYWNVRLRFDRTLLKSGNYTWSWRTLTVI